MSRNESAPEVLRAAVRTNDAAAVASVLERYPELKSQLDRPLPDFGFGATPLLGAVYRGNRGMIDVLLQAGANINARSDWWAGSFGVLDHDSELTDFLIERGAIVDVHAASRLGMLDRLDALISANPNLVHARGGDGQTPLHFAPSIPIAEYLLDRGADIDARDIDHESTPAQYMVRDRHEVARYLIGRGCRTDILMAAALGEVELVRKYLEADPSSIRTTVSEEYFPKQNPRSGGSIYNWTLGTGKTAHVIAREFGHGELFRVLMEHTPDELKLAVACEVGDEPMVTELLASRPNLAQALTGAELRTLVDAARDNNTAAVRLMLEAGWPADVRGQHGATPLHWAAWHGNTEMARELLRYNAPLETTDHDYGGTPLSWAIYGSVHGWRCETGDYAGTVDLLLKAGAQPPELTEDLEASQPGSAQELAALTHFIPSRAILAGTSWPPSNSRNVTS
jgi:ankyrin repeat protein